MILVVTLSGNPSFVALSSGRLRIDGSVGPAVMTTRERKHHAIWC